MICKNFSETHRLLRVENLHFGVPNRTILQDLSFSLQAGKLNVLVGPNGAGKSTLLRILSGYLKPTSGSCFFQEQAIADYTVENLAKMRSVMKQHNQINFPFSAREVLEMGGYHRRKSEVEQYLDFVVELTDCRKLLDKTYRSLSGGEQQRIQLARALLQIWSEEMHGKLLFLDEPTSAFDLYHQQHCLRLMKQLCQEKGLTVFCILHDLNLASLFGDHILLLANAQIQIQGKPDDVLTEAHIYRWYQAEIKTLPHYEKAIPQFQFCY